MARHLQGRMSRLSLISGPEVPSTCPRKWKSVRRVRSETILGYEKLLFHPTRTGSEQTLVNPIDLASILPGVGQTAHGSGAASPVVNAVSSIAWLSPLPRTRIESGDGVNLRKPAAYAHLKRTPETERAGPFASRIVVFEKNTAPKSGTRRFDAGIPHRLICRED